MWFSTKSIWSQNIPFPMTILTFPQNAECPGGHKLIDSIWKKSTFPVRPSTKWKFIVENVGKGNYLPHPCDFDKWLPYIEFLFKHCQGKKELQRIIDCQSLFPDKCSRRFRIPQYKFSSVTLTKFVLNEN